MSEDRRTAHRIPSIFKRGGSLKGRAIVLAVVVAIAAVVGVSAALSSGGAVAAHETAGTLYFGDGTAKLVGETALVPVKCVGAKGAECTGKLSLEAGGATSSAPFSVTRGAHRLISIRFDGASAGESVRATVKSAQPTGSYATATEVLQLR